MTNANDIVSGVYSRLGVSNIPSEITSGDILDFVTDRINDINLLTERSIISSSIPTDYVSPVKDLVTADVMARTIGIDIDTEIGIGNIRLAYRDQYQAENRQLEYYLAKAEKNLSKMGAVVRFGYTNKVS